MTLPRVTSDLLMFPPSFRRTPVAPVASARSLPARSTRWILLTVSLGISESNLACNRQKPKGATRALRGCNMFAFLANGMVVLPMTNKTFNLRRDLREVDSKDGV